MSEITYDIGVMLDGLGLTTSAIRWKEILESPELGNYSAQQLLREVLTPQYIEAMDRRYETNLKLSKLIDRQARIGYLGCSDHLHPFAPETQEKGRCSTASPPRTSWRSGRTAALPYPPLLAR